MSISKTTSDAFYEALDTIIENKIQNAGYDSTIHGTIVGIVSEGQGLYNIKYQNGTLYNVRSANPSISYQIGQRVIITLPNGQINSPNKYISNSIDMKVTSFKNIEELGVVAYTQIGKNSITITKRETDSDKQKYPLINDNDIFKISSYQTKYYPIYKYSNTNFDNYITIDQNAIKNNIKKGNGLIVGCTLQTQLDFSQTGGQYGIEIDVYIEEQYTGVAATHTYVVGSRQIKGNPFTVDSPTPVKIFIDDIDLNTFKRISEIRLYCKDFLVQDVTKNDKDIFISNIIIAGGQSTGEHKTQSDAVLLIDTSDKINKEGNQLSQTQPIIKLKAQLLVKGKKVTQGVKYLWFREDGRVFGRNNEDQDILFSKWGGAGWNCINKKTQNNTAQKNNSPIFYLTTNLNDHVAVDEYRAILGLSENQTIANFQQYNAYIHQKEQKVKCVALYDNNTASTEGQITIFNENGNNTIKIVSSDRVKNENQTIYFLNNGSPTLTCKVYNKNGEDITKNCEYTWSKKNSSGKIEKITNEQLTTYYNAYWKFKGYVGEERAFKLFSSDLITNTQTEDGIEYKAAHSDKKTAEKIRKDKNSQNADIQGKPYKTAKQQYNHYFDGKTSFCVKNVYGNFPISSISGSITLICAVSDGTNYLGASSITLENKIQLPSRYYLEIINATQVFKYDNKGNSPTSPQFENSKNKIEIKPLSFNLVDKDGHKVTIQRLLQSGGTAKWLVPKNNTLLSTNYTPSRTGDNDQLISNAVLPLSADSYNVYDITDSSLQSFEFKIANKFSDQYINNDIVLYVAIDNENIFTDITNFTFPKQGDSGTNGTDYFAILTTGTEENSERLYVNNYNNVFDDNDNFNETGNDSDNTINQIKLNFYNNSVMLNSGFNSSISLLGKNHLIKFNASKVQNDNSSNNPENIFNNNDTEYSNFISFVNNYNYVNILRGIATVAGGDIKNYAEMPICYNFVKNGQSDMLANWRVKIKPKTGFQYVVYAEDGTRPDYRTSPFELQVQHLINDQYRIETDSNKIRYTWKTNKNLILRKPSATTVGTSGSTATIQPANLFNGEDLISTVFCLIEYNNASGSVAENWTKVALLCAPIYMCINRYGHQALNSWDGNSIDLGTDGNTILAPQIGAGGKKEGENGFTGIVMGVEHTPADQESPTSTGLFGYNNGQRTIFLDANSGKAEFGKNSSGKIVIDPSQKIKNKDIALLYSNQFGVSQYITDLKNNNVTSSSTYNSDSTATTGAGMMLNLTTPEIRFGSAKFSVNKNGEMTAAAGYIGPWEITPNALTNGNVGLGTTTVPSSAFDTSTDITGKIWAKSGSGADNPVIFTVANNGYTYMKRGKIAGWTITPNKLEKELDNNYSIGLQAAPSASNSTPTSQTVAFYAGQGSAPDSKEFYVTFGGELHSKAGQIANWSITSSALYSTTSDGTIGMGSTTLPAAIGEDATFWSYRYNANLTPKRQYFYVTPDGKIGANAGKIGGWQLSDSALTSTKNNGSITINSDGTITGTKGAKSWTINNDGTATFDDITANGGKIGKWTISSNGSLTNDAVTIDKDGDIQCKIGDTVKWGIYHSGNASFKNITYLGGNMGGGTLTNSGGMELARAAGITGGAGGSAFGYTLDNNGKMIIEAADIGDLTIEELTPALSGVTKKVGWIQGDIIKDLGVVQEFHAGSGWIPVYNNSNGTGTPSYVSVGNIVTGLTFSAKTGGKYILIGNDI